MKRAFLLVLTILLLVLMTTGCWNRRELNELSIVGAIGIDKEPGADQYMFSVQVINQGVISSKGGGEGIGQASVTTFEMETSSMFEGMRRLTTVSPRKLYLAHMRMLILSEEVAKEGVGPILDLFSRDHEYRPDFYVIVTKDTKAGDVLKQFTQIEKVPANKLFSSLEMSEKHWAPTVAVRLDEVEASLVSLGKQPVLTGVMVRGDERAGESEKALQRLEPPAYVVYTGIGVFRGDKLVGWLNEEESKGYNYIADNVKSTVGPLACPQKGEVILEMIRSSSNVQAKFQNGKPQIQIKIKAEGNVGEVLCDVDLQDPKTIEKLERNGEQRIKQIIQRAVDKAQHKYRSDIFGFGEVIHREDAKYWKKIQGEWDEVFPHVPVVVDVDLQIRRTGTKVNSYLTEMRKAREKAGEQK